MFASFRVIFCVIGRNTNLVKAADAPKSYKDLLDPKWAGKIVKAHPGYSGTILTATFQIARDAGLGLFRETRQAEDHAGAIGDRSAQEARARRARDHGRRRRIRLFQAKETGEPVEVVYPAEGTPLIIGPNGVFKSAPNPNAARLFQNYRAHGGVPAVHRRFRRAALGAQLVKEKPGRKAFRNQGDEGRRGRGRERRASRSKRAKQVFRV